MYDHANSLESKRSKRWKFWPKTDMDKITPAVNRSSFCCIFYLPIGWAIVRTQSYTSQSEVVWSPLASTLALCIRSHLLAISQRYVPMLCRVYSEQYSNSIRSVNFISSWVPSLAIKQTKLRAPRKGDSCSSHLLFILYFSSCLA